MILLGLLFLSRSYSFALPTLSDIPIDTPSSFFTRDADRFNTVCPRTTFSIFWSCLSTIFTCTWIAIHTNIPGPKDTKLVVFRRRLVLMAYALIMPEMLLVWAGRQHRAAGRLSERYKTRGWTMVHGFFLVMGGFTLHDKEGTALRILEWKELDTLSRAGKIAWPSITEEEIQEKSKGDYLSKAIVLLQIGWFLTQFFARLGYGLTVSLLEVVTLALTVYTGSTYYLWWHKPLDVRFSVPVRLLENENIDSEGIRSGSPAAKLHSDPNLSCEHLESTQAHVEDNELPQLPPFVSEPYFHVSYPAYPLEDETIDSDSKSEGVHSGSPGTNPPSGPDSCEPVEGLESSPVQRDVASQFSTREENQLLQQPLIVSETGRGRGNPNDPIASPHNNSTTTSDSNILHRSMASIRKIAVFPITIIYDAASTHTLDHAAPLRVPTLYSPMVGRKTLNLRVSLSMLVALAVSQWIYLVPSAVDGTVHFPSTQERKLWIYMVVAMVFAGSCMIFYYVITIVGKRALSFGGIIRASIAVYLIAKITFLILALMQFRALPKTTLVAIEWTSLFPHLG